MWALAFCTGHQDRRPVWLATPEAQPNFSLRKLAKRDSWHKGAGPMQADPKALVHTQAVHTICVCSAGTFRCISAPDDGDPGSEANVFASH